MDGFASLAMTKCGLMNRSPSRRKRRDGGAAHFIISLTKEL